ncbi:MAG: hypothetical protein J6U20_12900 [Fibrobacter sp.]|nr:hypothetical protein [Fibrobacter sp.]
MDLREKPGKVQKFLELMLRFRLIALVVMVVASVTFVATAFSEFVGFPLGASESFGMWFAEVESVQSLWSSAQYLFVAGVACVVLLFVFGGVRAGIASMVTTLACFAALYVLDGGEGIVLPMFGILALVALALFLFVKNSVACALFPFVLCSLFLTGLLHVCPWGLSESPMELWWAAFAVFAFANSMAFALVAGKHLGAGVPQAGALVKSARQMLVPVLVGALLLVVAVVQSRADGAAGTSWPNAVLRYVVLVAWFFVFFFPITSFAPWERLRAGTRRVQMKDKKKKSKK